MPSSVEDLVWYIMCFTITTGFPTIIVIALKIHKLLYDIVVKQAVQEKWIESHETSTINNLEEIWGAIRELRQYYHELVK